MILFACATEGGNYYAIKHRDTETVFHQFTAPAEHKAGLQILRFAYTSASLGSFTSKTNLSAAHVSPAGPFNGSADFSARTGTLSGDLTATVPGIADPLDLTSDDAVLGKSFETVDGCGNKHRHFARRFAR